MYASLHTNMLFIDILKGKRKSTTTKHPFIIPENQYIQGCESFPKVFVNVFMALCIVWYYVVVFAFPMRCLTVYRVTQLCKLLNTVEAQCFNGGKYFCGPR